MHTKGYYDELAEIERLRFRQLTVPPSGRTKDSGAEPAVAARPSPPAVREDSDSASP